MKIILLSIAFCALINTAKAQVSTLANKTVNNKTDEVMDPEKRIAENLSKCRFSHLFYRSVTRGDLVETFNNTGPLTLFLPADTALSKLPHGRLDSLLMPQNKYQLIALLTYHALPGNLSAKNIAKHIRRGKGKTSFHTIAGAWLHAEFDPNGNVILIDENGGRCVMEDTDLKQKNGVIHLVSSVLTPKFQPI